MMKEEDYSELVHQLERKFWVENASGGLDAYTVYVGSDEWVCRLDPEAEQTLYLLVGLSEGWWKPGNVPRRPQILLVRG